jgi:hypothetical protein
MSNSETMTKIRISNDQNLFFEVGCFKFGAFEILIFEFVSNFVFRYSDFHPFATQTTKEPLCPAPKMWAMITSPRGEGGCQRCSTPLLKE